MSQIRAAIVFIVLMTLLTGIIYPLAITGVAEIVFPRQAHGSLIMRDGKVIGFELIGQNFASDKYFHGRPSATTAPDPSDASKTVPAPYNAANSGGSNFGPTNKVFFDTVRLAADTLHVENSRSPVPVDLATASGSGLDPHITPAAAKFQVARVAKARNIPETELAALVTQFTETRTLGFIGEPRVNVLELNLALDNMDKGKKR